MLFSLPRRTHSAHIDTHKWLNRAFELHRTFRRARSLFILVQSTASGWRNNVERLVAIMKSVAVALVCTQTLRKQYPRILQSMAFYLFSVPSIIFSLAALWRNTDLSHPFSANHSPSSLFNYTQIRFFVLTKPNMKAMCTPTPIKTISLVVTSVQEFLSHTHTLPDYSFLFFVASAVWTSVGQRRFMWWVNSAIERTFARSLKRHCVPGMRRC